ncbi:MAG: hypothetical protein ACM3ZQ_07345 [Bacillota bacterium]
MWIIRWRHTTTGRQEILREGFAVGKVLQFEREEDAFRLIEILRRSATKLAYPLAFTTQRYAGDRREKQKLVKDNTWDRTVNDLAAGMEIEAQAAAVR